MVKNTPYRSNQRLWGFSSTCLHICKQVTPTSRISHYIFGAVLINPQRRWFDRYIRSTFVISWSDTQSRRNSAKLQLLCWPKQASDSQRLYLMIAEKYASKSSIKYLSIPLAGQFRRIWHILREKWPFQKWKRPSPKNSTGFQLKQTVNIWLKQEN